MPPTAAIDIAQTYNLSPSPCFPPRPTKRKPEGSTTESKSAKRQKTVSIQETPQKLAKSPKTAKTSSPAHSCSSTPSIISVVTRSTPSQVPGTVLSQEDSAISTGTPTPRTITQQAGANAFQYANSATTSAILPAPIHGPTACFNQTMPQPFTPWPHTFPAPTPRFTQPLSTCPVNWASIVGSKQENIEAYEPRAPWNPVPTTFEAVTKPAQRVKGRVVSQECIRKRFKKACLGVFRCSGVYFEESALGLESYGVPKQQHLNRLIEAAKQTVHNTIFVDTTPSPLNCSFR